jgi:putative sporulation protein YtaF
MDMQWLSIVLIGIVANLDNLGIGVAYGVQSTRIPYLSNLIIAIIGAMITYLSVSLGGWIGTYISHHLANLGGGVLLILLGGWTIWSEIKKLSSPQQRHQSHYLRQILDNPEKADKDKNQVISLKESILLGLALSLNCFGVGFGGGVSGVSPLWSGLLVGLISFFTIGIGVRIGLEISHSWINKFACTLAGLLLIGIGLIEIII